MENGLAFSKWFGNKDAVIFDLDGTIYREWDYLSQAYREIGRDIEIKFGISHLLIYPFLENEFLAGNRHGLFNKLIDKFRLPSSYMPEALYILRNIKMTEKLACYREITECLEWLVSRDKQIFIVTNGNTIQQKNKIGNIEFGSLLKHINVIYADEIKPKPDPEAFFYMQKKIRGGPKEIVMIGDSPTDESFAAAAGIDFIHVKNIIHLS